MDSIPTPPAHEVGRLWRPTVAATLDAIVGAVLSSKPKWNYQPAQNLSSKAFSGPLPWSAIEHHCLNTGHPDGHKPNLDVCRLVRAEAEGKEFLIDKIPPKLVDLRPGDASTRVRVRANFVYSEGGKPKIFALQPRKSFAPDLVGMQIWMSLLAYLYKDGDLQHAELRVLDLSAPEGSSERLPRWFSDVDVPLLGKKELDDAMSVFVEALELARVWGVQNLRPRPERRQSSDDGTGDLFK